MQTTPPEQLLEKARKELKRWFSSDKYENAVAWMTCWA
jgi:hypothetical protein